LAARGERRDGGVVEERPTLGHRHLGAKVRPIHAVSIAGGPGVAAEKAAGQLRAAFKGGTMRRYRALPFLTKVPTRVLARAGGNAV